MAALKKFPEFNSSLSPEKDALILKQYYNIGIAVDTPGGLVVPVVKDADRKGIVELSREFMAISAKARDGKLGPSRHGRRHVHHLQPGRHRRHQLHPDRQRPRGGHPRAWSARRWPRSGTAPSSPRATCCRISLSYDHRVVDGALAARFARHLCYLLEDDRRLLL